MVMPLKDNPVNRKSRRTDFPGGRIGFIYADDRAIPTYHEMFEYVEIGWMK